MLAALAIAPVVAIPAPAEAADLSLWQTRRAEYQIAHALAKAAQKYGPATQVLEDYDQVRSGLMAKLGSIKSIKQDPVASTIFDAAWGRQETACARDYRLYSTPANDAAIALALTPAPTIEALEYKLEVIESHELFNDSDMPRNPFEVVLEDARRLRERGPESH